MIEHIQIGAGFKMLGGDQNTALDLVERKFEFVGAVRGVDAHHDGTNFGGSQLHHYPFVAIGNPDADSISRFNTKR